MLVSAWDGDGRSEPLAFTNDRDWVYLFYSIFILHTWWWLFFIVWWQHQPKVCPATWWITVDYQADTFIWSVSWVILSSLTLHLTPVPARSTTTGFQSRRDSRERNETYFTCLLLPLLGMCERMSCWKAAVSVWAHMCSHKHTGEHLTVALLSDLHPVIDGIYYQSHSSTGPPHSAIPHHHHCPQ